MVVYALQLSKISSGKSHVFTSSMWLFYPRPLSLVGHVYNTLNISQYLLTYDFLCNLIFYFDNFYIELCTCKNYKKLILWKYTIRRFKQDPTWLYFYLHISHNIQYKLERWIVPKTKRSKYLRTEEVFDY